jgi:hypothetical protein
LAFTNITNEEVVPTFLPNGHPNLPCEAYRQALAWRAQERNAMNPALQDALEFYRRQVSLAEDRIRRFESGEMSVGDIGPPYRDTTVAAIENEKQIIHYFQRGIEIIEKLNAQRP